MRVITVLRTYLDYPQIRLSQEAGITQLDLFETENMKPYGHPDKYICLSRVLGATVDALQKNGFTGIPESFFDAHLPQGYRLAVPAGCEWFLADGKALIKRTEWL